MKLIIRIILAAAILWLTWHLVGCGPSAKQATAYMYAHPEVNAPVCSTQFKPTIKYVKGDTVTKTDTVVELVQLTDIDTVKVDSMVYIYVPKPGKTQTIYKTKTVTDTVFQDDPAAVKALTDANNKLVVKIGVLEAYKESKKGKWSLEWYWFIIILCAGILIGKFQKLF